MRGIGDHHVGGSHSIGGSYSGPCCCNACGDVMRISGDPDNGSDCLCYGACRTRDHCHSDVGPHHDASQYDLNDDCQRPLW